MIGIYHHRHEGFRLGGFSHGRQGEYGFRIDPKGKVTIWPEKEEYRAKEVRLILAVSHQTVHRAIHSGALKAERVGGVRNAGKWLISHEALRIYIAAGQKMAPKGRRPRA